MCETAARPGIETAHRIVRSPLQAVPGGNPIPRRCAAQPRSLSEATQTPATPGAYPCLGFFLWRPFAFEGASHEIAESRVAARKARLIIVGRSGPFGAYSITRADTRLTTTTLRHLGSQKNRILERAVDMVVSAFNKGRS